MDFHQLRVFQSAARTASFTAAGRELLLSQSTVSLHIKQLEEELGCSLFVRSRKRVSLSEAGYVLLQYADRVLAEIKNATLAVQEFSSLKRGTIRLGVGATTLTYLLPKVLGEFRGKYPQLEVVVTTGTTEVLLESLLGNRLDFAIVMSPSDALQAVECIPLMQEELVVVLAAEHPLAQCGELSAKDLDGGAWISHLRGTAMHVIQQRYFEQLGVQPRFSVELENMEAMKHLAASGMGMVLLPQCSVADAHGQGLATKSVSGVALSRELLLASLGWDEQPPATRRLAGLILQALGGETPGASAKALIESANELYEDYVVSSAKPVS